MGSNGENDRPPKGQGEYVFLDNLPETANQILNVLWIENREMSVEEMTERVNQEFSTNRDWETVKQFLKMFVKWDYA